MRRSELLGQVGSGWGGLVEAGRLLGSVSKAFNLSILLR